MSTGHPPPKAEGQGASAPQAEGQAAPPAPDRALDQELDQEDRPQRRWVWMDRWDPGTWEMPSNPTPLQRVLAGVALVILFVMIFYVPFRMLGVF